MIGEALANAKTVFDIAKLELLYNIILIYFIIYIFGTIPVLVDKYWLIIIVQVIGFSFIVAMAIAVKRSKNIKLPRRIWFVSGIVFTLSSALLNSGQASFLTYAFSMVNIVISFLLLGRFLRNIAIIYYVIFLTIATSITLGIIPKILLPIDLTKEHEFFSQSNINAILIAFVMIAFIIDRFINSHKIATKQILEQKEHVVNQKKLLEKKNETIITSIELATKIQSDKKIDQSTILSYFSDFFHIHLPKGNLSGEFFWVKEYKSTIYFAIVDTGENDVPGAMLSYMVRNALNKALKEAEIESPKNILQFINNFMKQSLLNADGVNSHVKISLCQFGFLANELHLTGVAQPVIIQKAGQLKTYYPKNQSLDYLDSRGKVDEAKIQLAKGDIIYLFSDGVSEGGVTAESQTSDYSSFKSVLYAHTDKEMSQKKILLEQFYKPLKPENRQTDDITIVGLKI